MKENSKRKPAANITDCPNRSIRMSDQTYDDISTIKHALGCASAEKALRAMVNTFSMSAAKETLPERSMEIAEFEILCRKLIDSYTHSLILCHDADKRAREDVKQKLESKEVTIIDLQTKLKEQEGKLAALEQELMHAQAERDAAVSEAETLKQASRNDALVLARFDELQQQLNALVQPK